MKIEIDKEKLEEIMADIDAGLQRGHNALRDLIEEPKWEPKGGMYTLFGSGNIQSNKVFYDYRQNGAECATKKQAEILRDMTKRNNLIFQAIQEKGYECKKGQGYEIVKKDGYWTIIHTNYPCIPENLIDTREHAEEILKMVGLNED